MTCYTVMGIERFVKVTVISSKMFSLFLTLLYVIFCSYAAGRSIKYGNEKLESTPDGCVPVHINLVVSFLGFCSQLDSVMIMVMSIKESPIN